MPERGHIPTGPVVVDSGGWGYVRLNPSPPAEPWERAELWNLLARHAERAGLAVSVEYRPGDRGAEQVEVYAVTQGIGVRRRLAPVGEPVRGWPDEYGVTIHRLEGDPAGAVTMRAVGRGDVLHAVEVALGDPAVAYAMGERWGAVVKAKPGRRGRTDLFYAAAALDYVRARQVEPAAPVRRMADEGAGTVDEIRARLRRARERGLLTAAPAGRPGGDLTDKAVDLLRAAGLLEGGR